MGVWVSKLMWSGKSNKSGCLQITQHKWAWPFMKPVDVKGLGLHDYHEVSMLTYLSVLDPETH
jgi:hypothetical protein